MDFNSIFAGFDLYFYLWCFFLYAFLGWCTEVAFAAVHSGKFVNRGFLNGPLCPIYGAGMVVIIFFLTPLKDNALLLFIGAALLTTLLEFITGFVLEKCFHQKWWDYSARPFNIGGYICLEFSILWGLACLLVMDIVHPLITLLISNIIPLLLGKILLGFLIVIMLADLIATVASITKLNRRLKQIDDLAQALKKTSDALGENIYEKTAAAIEKKEEMEQKTAKLKEAAAQRKEESSEAAKERKEAFLENIEAKKEAVAQRSLEFKESLENKKEAGAESIRERKASMEENLEANLENLRAKLTEVLNSQNHTHKRLLKAFPNMQSKRYKEALEQLKSHIQK